jgi:glutathione S-transferase
MTSNMFVERTVLQFPLDPGSRQIRLALGEKRLAFSEQIVRYWEQPTDLMLLNRAGVPPVMIESRGATRIVICEPRAILEHIEEQDPEPPLLGRESAERAEARRLMQWFDRKFDNEVNSLLLYEKLEKRLLGRGAPDLAAIRRGKDALRQHLGYLEDLLRQREWLAGRRLSLADIAAAAHLSVIDYFGDVPWSDVPLVKEWYMRMKSRPCFRPLLADRWPGLVPANHYADLDF